MNKIQGILDINQYEGCWEFVNFKIDNYWLKDKIEQLYPGNMYGVLVPTLTNWMDREDEIDVVWKRIYPDYYETTICPIFMCPEDLDFSCSLIVAEVKNCGDIIQWKRIGIDKTQGWEADRVGINVEWFDKIEELNFSKEDYLIMLENFKDRFPIDKARND